MKNEIMYDGITGIREDIVLQAENYQFDKKSRNITFFVVLHIVK